MILIAWPASVILALLVGVQWRTAIEKEVGIDNVYKDRVTRFRFDVAGFAKGQDPRTSDLLNAVSILALAIIEPEKYDELRAEAVNWAKRANGDPNAFPVAGRGTRP